MKVFQDIVQAPEGSLDNFVKVLELESVKIVVLSSLALRSHQCYRVDSGLQEGTMHVLGNIKGLAIEHTHDI